MGEPAPDPEMSRAEDISLDRRQDMSLDRKEEEMPSSTEKEVELDRKHKISFDITSTGSSEAHTGSAVQSITRITPTPSSTPSLSSSPMSPIRSPVTMIP